MENFEFHKKRIKYKAIISNSIVLVISIDNSLIDWDLRGQSSLGQGVTKHHPSRGHDSTELYVM